MITVADAKIYLKLTSSDYDTLLGKLVTAVDKLIESYCNRVFDEAVYYELYDGEGDNKIILNNYPVCSIIKLADSLDKQNKTYDNLYSAYEYHVHSKNGIIEADEFNFAEGQKSIYVEYRAGYGGSGDDKILVPDDYKDAAIGMIAKKFYDFQEKRFNITAKSLMAENINFEIKDMSDLQKAVFDMYRNPCSDRRGVTVTQYSEAS